MNKTTLKEATKRVKASRNEGLKIRTPWWVLFIG
jgi:hypothetical protein